MKQLSQTQNKSKMVATAELIRKGAAILQEPCPRCGAVQIRYKGSIYCTNEDEISSNLDPKISAEPPSSQSKSVITSEKPSSPQPSQSSESLRKLLEEKLDAVSKQLDSTSDLSEQTKLLDLISKYIETLEKLRKSN